MAVEIFGSEAGAYAAIACVFSYLCSGHAGIYRSQRIGAAKGGTRSVEADTSMAIAAKLEGLPGSVDTPPSSL